MSSINITVEQTAELKSGDKDNAKGNTYCSRYKQATEHARYTDNYNSQNSDFSGTTLISIYCIHQRLVRVM
jgi:hypothetical protein